ncbi:hypothetical protein JCM13304A_14580 [Desulfothermus okinawensis JCM 13304]
MLKLIIVFIAGYLLYKLITGEKKHKVKEDISHKIKAGEMVKDPVCGTYVSINSDIRVRDGDKTYCFCSYECRDKYLKKIKENN